MARLPKVKEERGGSSAANDPWSSSRGDSILLTEERISSLEESYELMKADLDAQRAFIKAHKEQIECHKKTINRQEFEIQRLHSVDAALREVTKALHEQKVSGGHADLRADVSGIMEQLQDLKYLSEFYEEINMKVDAMGKIQKDMETKLSDESSSLGGTRLVAHQVKNGADAHAIADELLHAQKQDLVKHLEGLSLIVNKLPTKKQQGATNDGCNSAKHPWGSALGNLYCPSDRLEVPAGGPNGFSCREPSNAPDRTKGVHTDGCWDWARCVCGHGNGNATEPESGPWDESI
ncbi:hypothetical protein ACO1O0_002869 [Amphichorda felina]